MATKSNGKAPDKADQRLQEFKTKIKDLLTSDQDDYELEKWLKARNYDVNKAEQMYRASVAYRKKMEVDTLLKSFDPPEVLRRYVAGGVCGVDKEGSPVRVELFGHLDMKGLMYSAKRVDMEKYKLWQCEKIVSDWDKYSKQSSKRVDGLTVIFDMEGVTTKMLWRPGLQMYMNLVRILEDNYPEMMKKMFVVNAPGIFPLLYRICRPLISQDMKNKIHVLSGNYQAVLLKYVDADNLPVYLGGTLTGPDGDPRCANVICPGGDVPSSYFLKEREKREDTKSVTVPRGERVLLPYTVDQPGSVLKWEFFAEDHDIGFGVFLQDGDDLQPLVPVERVNCHMVPEDGTLECKQSGTYVICFDNKFSWARGKEIFYNAEVITPDERLSEELDKMEL